MLSRRTFVALACVAASLSGCSKYYYNPAPQVLPQYIRKIAVRPFANQTSKYHIEDKLTMAVHSAFNRDGRWEIVAEDKAEGVLIGTITRYILMPTKHDANDVASEFKLWVLVDVSFYDLAKQQTLWAEKNLEAKMTAPRSSTGLSNAMSEPEAQEKLWEQLAKDITTRTFEGFGTVTGISEKAAPKSAPGEFGHQPLPPTPPDYE